MTDTEPSAACVECRRSADETPLLSFEYRGSAYRICPQHLPWLIHDPGRLAGQLPGAEDLAPGSPPG